MKVTADEGWAYNPKIKPASRSDDSRARGDLLVAVNLMPFQVVANVFRSKTTRPLNNRELNDHILSVILGALESLTPRRLRLLLLPMSSQDLVLCSKLQALLHGRVPCEVHSDLDSQYAALSRSQILLGMRMHTIMMAAQVAIPSIAIGLLPKVFELMRSLGLSEYAVRGLQLDATAFQDILNRALQNADSIRALMNERVMSLREIASLNAKVIRALLTIT